MLKHNNSFYISRRVDFSKHNGKKAAYFFLSLLGLLLIRISPSCYLYWSPYWQKDGMFLTSSAGYIKSFF